MSASLRPVPVILVSGVAELDADELGVGIQSRAQ